MIEPFQLPSVNALTGADKDILRMALNMLVAEVNELRKEISVLKSAQSKNRGY